MQVTKTLTLSTKPNIKLTELRGLIVHWTSGLGSSNTADSWLSTWENSSQKGVGAHYSIDATQLVQYVPDDEVVYHAGGDPGPTFIVNTLFGGHINNYTVGLEICVCDGQDYPTIEKRAIQFCADFLKAHNMTTDALFRHFDSTTKPCPLQYLEPDKWHAFIAQVKAYMESTETDEEKKIAAIQNVYASDSDFRSFMQDRHAYEAQTSDYYDNQLWAWSKQFSPDDRGIKTLSAGSAGTAAAVVANIENVSSPMLNNLYISNAQYPGGDSSHCVKPENFSNIKLTSKDLSVEPIYPDLIMAPGQSTGYFNNSQGSVSQSSNILFDDLVTEYESRQKIFDPNKYKDEVKKDKGKIINNNDPYAVDDKITQLEKHHPKVKIDTWEVKTKDCNHPACSLGNAVKEDVIELVDVVTEVSARTEKRLSALENITATLMRNLFRLSSRVNINCVYYGGQDTFQKYNCIRCLQTDRVNDGQSVSIDQCLACTRYEPIIGQVYDILDESGMNLSQVLDDTQMSYMNMNDYIELSRTEQMHSSLDKASFKDTMSTNSDIKNKIDDLRKQCIKTINAKITADKIVSIAKQKVQSAANALKDSTTTNVQVEDTSKDKSKGTNTTEETLTMKNNLYDVFGDIQFTLDDFNDPDLSTATTTTTTDATVSKTVTNTTNDAKNTNVTSTTVKDNTTNINSSSVPEDCAKVTADDITGSPQNNIQKVKRRMLLNKLLYSKLKEIDKTLPENFLTEWDNGFIMDYSMKKWELEQPNINKYKYTRSTTEDSTAFNATNQYNSGFTDTRSDATSAEKFEIKGDNYDSIFPDTTTMDGISSLGGDVCRQKILDKAKEIIALCASGKAEYNQIRPTGSTLPDGKIGYDCSGFVQTCYAAAGLKIGSWTGEQYPECLSSAGGLILPISDQSKAIAGDLIFFSHEVTGDPTNLPSSIYSDGSNIHHVAIYAGDGNMYESSSHHADPTIDIRQSPISGRDAICFARPTELIKADAAYGGKFQQTPGAIDNINYVGIFKGAICTQYTDMGNASDGTPCNIDGQVAAAHGMRAGTQIYIPDFKGKVNSTGILTVHDSGGPFYDFDLNTSYDVGKGQHDVYVIKWGTGPMMESFDDAINEQKKLGQWGQFETAYDQWKDKFATLGFKQPQ